MGQKDLSGSMLVLLCICSRFGKAFECKLGKFDVSMAIQGLRLFPNKVLDILPFPRQQSFPI